MLDGKFYFIFIFRQTKNMHTHVNHKKHVPPHPHPNPPAPTHGVLVLHQTSAVAVFFCWLWALVSDCSMLLSEPSPPTVCECVLQVCVCFLWWRGGQGEQTCPFESVVAELILTSAPGDMQQVKLSTVATVAEHKEPMTRLITWMN